MTVSKPCSCRNRWTSTLARRTRCGSSRLLSMGLISRPQGSLVFSQRRLAVPAMRPRTLLKHGVVPWAPCLVHQGDHSDRARHRGEAGGPYVVTDRQASSPAQYEAKLRLAQKRIKLLQDRISELEMKNLTVSEPIPLTDEEAW